MHTLDYRNVFSSNFYEKSQRHRRIFSFYFFVSSFLSTNWLFAKLNKKLGKQLLNAKSIHAFISENIDYISDEYIKVGMVKIENTIRELYSIESDIEAHLKNPRFRRLISTSQLVAEMLDVMHSTLRLLKKKAIKSPLPEASEEAKVAVAHSQNTLNSKLHGR